MRKLVCAIVAVLALLVTVLPGCAEEKGEETKYKVGLNVGVSGYMSDWNLAFRDGFLLKVKQINEAGGINGHSIEVILYDNGSNPAKGVLTAKKQIDEDKVLMIAVGESGGAELAIKPICEKSKVPLLIGSGIEEALEPPATFIFKFLPPAAMGLGLMYEAMRDVEGTKIGAMFVDIAYGMDRKRFLERSHELMGYEVVAIEQFGVMDVDVTPQLTRIAQSGAEILLIMDVTIAGVIAAQQAKDMRLGIPIFVSNPMVTEAYMEAMPGALEGIYSATARVDVVEVVPDDDPQKPIILNFREAFRAEYGRSPATEEPLGYDVGTMVAEALRIANPDLADVDLARSQIRDALEQVNFMGAWFNHGFSPDEHDSTPWMEQLWARITVENDELKFVRWITEVEALQYR